ncbi:MULTISPECIES: type IV conjugative transfer system lipoprotein TraV [Vibrio]|uniref:IncF plasmid conjugative transfer pilus assemblyprotein TraV n=1 Tax=Vibrio splendidus TaxID=29497 RepID=A0A0H3ZVQ2_VIBSP|nr:MULTISPECIES: type IV conjugative transfer system lipoprotein TraV [Vibrio]AKN37566.1 IncF plasmid conjugative transfer pilus assemblyprotein TraV [Vibrio splendidus]AKN37732.1 IncF plasmid conjugative transfer pilus assemblyprotein TraV [Vibrio splendidus]PMG26667.1 type IV conjugative transfer system protein TraV [Vibrio splendidus]
MHKLIVFLPLLLGGCAAGLGEDFSCTQVGGTSGCTTMDEIRRQPMGTSPVSAVQAALDNVFLTLPRRDRQGVPKRTQDTVRKITIFPFTDTLGHYVDTTDIYVILDESRWSGRPANAIWKD